MQALDIAGTQIDVGDTVVYGVKSEHATLQMGRVEALIPFNDTRSVENPSWNPNKPTTYERRYDPNHVNDNPRWVREDFTNYKVKVRKPDTHYKDEFGDPQIQQGKAKTLDNPRRFAVIKKGP